MSKYCKIDCPPEIILRLKMDKDFECPYSSPYDFNELVFMNVFYTKVANPVHKGVDRGMSLNRFMVVHRGKCIICENNPTPIIEREPYENVL